MRELPIFKHFGNSLRCIIAAATLLMSASALGDPGSIQLSSFPEISVADAHSSVTITAIVRDSAGRTVSDGTQVFFSTTLGSLRDTATETQGGLARVVLVAAGTPGTATIVATAASVGASASMDVPFLADRSLLAGAQEYAEIVTPGYLAMSVEKKVIEAASENYGVHLRYREITIAAERLQIDADSLEVKAKKARVVIAGVAREYEEVYLDLHRRQGYGTTSYVAKQYAVAPDGMLLRFVPIERDRFGPVKLSGKTIEPASSLAAGQYFRFTDLSDSTMKVTARKAVVFPRREVQFHKAAVVVQGSRAMKLPLFKVELQGTTPIISEQIVSINDSRIQINYPYYLSLQPGMTSSLRFHTGDSGGYGFSSIGGAFLDYNLNWNRGDASQGGFTFGGIGRSDFQLSANQFLRLDNRSTFSAQLNSTALSSVFGTVDYSHELGPFQLSADANAGRSLVADETSVSQSVGLNLNSSPERLGNAPVTFTYGLTGLRQSDSVGDGESASQTEIGAQARFQMQPRVIGPATQFNSFTTVGQFFGQDVNRLPTVGAGTSVSKQISKQFSTSLSYNFTDDPYSRLWQGEHQLSLQSGLKFKRVKISLSADHSLDIDRSDYQTDLSYSLSSLWRFSYYSTFSRYFGSNFDDAGVGLLYNFQGHDIGIVWSQTTKRFGVQVLGATFH
jgi:hypothetical protein